MNDIARDLAVEWLPLAELTPYAANARTHSAEQVQQIADSVREFGWTNPVLVDEAGGIIAGHGRVMAAELLGLEQVPAITLAGLTEAQRRAYILADNKLALNAGWDERLLAAELGALQAEGFDVALTGFSEEELAELLAVEVLAPEPEGDPDATPEPEAVAISRPGDVWLLGPHRVMCGDSTSPTDVAKLLAGAVAPLLHADPPYGMGKEADGVENDNLYREELDQFQLAWWATWRPFLAENASVYVWGNAPDLWRLWYSARLGESERIELRNEIVWDKGTVSGMCWAGACGYQTASERALFFQLGEQFLGNVNADAFPESWEPLRSYLAGEAEAAGIGPAEVRELCRVQMFGHWFTRSQFTLIPEKHYATLAAARPGHFLRPWAELREEWVAVKSGPLSEIQARRSYFDNTHEAMTDVWRFERVYGEERHGHATPKPVEMMVRAIKSACPPGGLVLEPFGGSGSTLIGAERCGRVCYTMELQAVYADVIVRRWQQLTGKRATLESTGEPFPE